MDSGDTRSSPVFHQEVNQDGKDADEGDSRQNEDHVEKKVYGVTKHVYISGQPPNARFPYFRLGPRDSHP